MGEILQTDENIFHEISLKFYDEEPLKNGWVIKVTGIW